jgi:hypothetical protein
MGIMRLLGRENWGGRRSYMFVGVLSISVHPRLPRHILTASAMPSHALQEMPHMWPLLTCILHEPGKNTHVFRPSSFSVACYLSTCDADSTDRMNENCSLSESLVCDSQMSRNRLRILEFSSPAVSAANKTSSLSPLGGIRVDGPSRRLLSGETLRK